MNDSKVNLLNRLVDYFLVVGLNDDKEPELEGFFGDGTPVFKPSLIDRYPTKDYEDIPFPPGVEIFCIPAGITPVASIKLPKFHHFAMTLGNGDRLHGTCLRFYEPISEKTEERLSKVVKDKESEMKELTEGECFVEDTSPVVEEKRTDAKATDETSVNKEKNGKGLADTKNVDEGNSEAKKETSKTSMQDSKLAEAAKERSDKVDLRDIDIDCASTTEEKKEPLGLPTPESKFSLRQTQTSDVQDLGGLPPPASPPAKDIEGLGSSYRGQSLNTGRSSRVPRIPDQPVSTPVPTTLRVVNESEAEHKATPTSMKDTKITAPPTTPLGNEPASPTSKPPGIPDRARTTIMRGVSEGTGKEMKGNKRLFAEKCICIVSHYGYFDQYLDFLRELYRISLSPSKIPMERYIVNFTRETPLPPEGCLKIEYTIGQRVIGFSRPPPNRPIDFPPFPYAQLFRILKPETVVTAFTALLLEYRVILISTPLANLSIVSELLIRLMYPFQYEHVYIPILPKTLTRFLAAPMPFLIGIPWEFIGYDTDPKDILEDREDTIIIDLDHSEVYMSEEITLLPASERKKLQKRLAPLSKLFKPRKEMSALERKAFDGADSAFRYIPSPEELDILQEDVPLIDDGEVKSVQAAFLRVFVSLFKDYRRHLIFPRPSPPPPTKASPLPSPSTGKEKKDFKASNPFSIADELFLDEPTFKTKEFIRKQSRDSRDFLKKFLATQAFSRFSDQRVAPGPMPGESENYHIKFFDESIIAKNNRSRFRFSRPTPFLDGKEFEIKETLPAPAPDMNDLPKDKVYRHSQFPRLDPELFQARRETMLNSSSSNLKSRKKSKIYKKKMGLKSIPNLMKQLSHSKLKTLPAK